MTADMGGNTPASSSGVAIGAMLLVLSARSEVPEGRTYRSADARGHICRGGQ